MWWPRSHADSYWITHLENHAEWALPWIRNDKRPTWKIGRQGLENGPAGSAQLSRPERESSRRFARYASIIRIRCRVRLKGFRIRTFGWEKGCQRARHHLSSPRGFPPLNCRAGSAEVSVSRRIPQR